MRGRDIKRYNYDFANLWLLFIPWHFPLHNDQTITGASEKAEIAFKLQYPAVYNHLLKYKKELENRNKAETGIRYEWYALQRWGANYWEDFSKQKIVWGNLNLKASYTIVPEGFFVNAPCVMIVPANKYLLGVLNSKLADYFIRNLGVTRNGGYFEYKPMFIEQMPIPLVSEERQNQITSLVDDTPNSIFEKKIDEIVYQLYDLTDEEIEFIELLQS